MFYGPCDRTAKSIMGTELTQVVRKQSLAWKRGGIFQMFARVVPVPHDESNEQLTGSGA